MNPKETHEIVWNLKDAGLSDTEISDALALLSSNKTAEGIKRLKLYRCKRMNLLHKMQQQIDCLDYLIQQLQGFKE